MSFYVTSDLVIKDVDTERLTEEFFEEYGWYLEDGKFENQDENLSCTVGDRSISFEIIQDDAWVKSCAPGQIFDMIFDAADGSKDIEGSIVWDEEDSDITSGLDALRIVNNDAGSLTLQQATDVIWKDI